MAKKSSRDGNGPSKIRFIMLEAELNDGDLDQVTQAITNALRPAVVHQRLIAGVAGGGGVPADESEMIEDAEVIDDQDTSSASTRSGPRRPKKARSPKVLDLDLDSSVSFVDYANARNPSSDQKRYLVVAAWFKQHRDTNAITMDHVYTCYRKIKWPSNIADFDAGLRSLKGRQLMDRVAPGTYAINHLGIAEVDSLDAAPEA